MINAGPQVYNELGVYYQDNIIAPLIQTYGLAASLVQTQTSFADGRTDPDTGLNYIVNFTAMIGTGFAFPLNYETYVIFKGDASMILAILLATYANQMGIPIPKPLAPVVTVPVQPPPPTNPIGSAIDPDPFRNPPSVVRYNNMAGTAAESLSPFTAKDGTVYVVQIGGGIWGKSYWWVQQAALQAAQKGN